MKVVTVVFVLFIIGVMIVLREGNLRKQMIRESFEKDKEINEFKLAEAQFKRQAKEQLNELALAEKQFHDSLKNKDEKILKNDLYFQDDDLF